MFGDIWLYGSVWIGIMVVVTINKTYTFDVVVIGAGGSGLRVPLALEGYNVAVLSKVFPTRSHTVAAQGGINAALANMGEDDWTWHMYDTVVGSQFLGDQDAIEYMCKMAPSAVIELEHMGLPFSRTETGHIYQRKFGGQTLHYGKEQAQRTCAAKDRTGHALLHTLYQQNIKNKTQFFSEWLALNLVMESEVLCGVIAMDIAQGDIAFFKAPVVVIATGGGGRVYASTTNAYTCTGDGLALYLRAGGVLCDMEMWQFHPTGLYGCGALISEACRGEGGYLLNGNLQRFMPQYDKKADLACRDVVSRASQTEINEQRGAGLLKDHIWLQLTHLPVEYFETRLPGIREICMTYAGIDPIVDLIPVVPTNHYMMGGIPTTIHCEVRNMRSGQECIIPGLYAIGEAACMSIHGANRLGGNSLIDLVVFGKRAAEHIRTYLQSTPRVGEPSRMTLDKALAIISQERCEESSESFDNYRRMIQHTMQTYFSVYREESSMRKGLTILEDIAHKIAHTGIVDRSTIFNVERVEALETQNLLLIALATARSALYRTESRGAHSRTDYPVMDPQWQVHIWVDGKGHLTTHAVCAKTSYTEAIVP